jgi:PII-like signaling protein
VLRGIDGFGCGESAGGRSSGQSISRLLAERVPVIVEMVDAPERIARFVDEILPRHLGAGRGSTSALVTIEAAHVILYRQRGHGADTAADIDSFSRRSAAVLPAMKTRDDMTTNDTGVLLRIFIGDSDRHGNVPLYEAIVQQARALGMAGATVLRGSEGFGANSVVHKAKLLEMSTDLPVVIELVDVREKIELLLPHLDNMVGEGMITMEDVKILLYRHDPAAGVK